MFKKHEDVKTEAIISQSQQSRLSMTYKRLIILLTIVIIPLIGVGFYTASNKYKESHADCLGDSCTEIVHKPYLVDATNAITSNDYNALADIVSNIKKNVPNYDMDPDYLYVVVQYYIGIGDSKVAQSTFNTLKKVHKTKQYSQIIMSVALTDTDLQNSINSIIKQTQQNKSNTWQLTQPQ